MVKNLGWLAAGIVGVVAACGGTVVVDPGGASQGGAGQGGSGQGAQGAAGPGPASVTGVGASTSASTGPASCLPPPSGTLMGCSGSATGGQCSTFYCSEAGDTYEVNCTGSSCTCVFDDPAGGQIVCSCQAAGDVCAGAPDCCNLL